MKRGVIAVGSTVACSMLLAASMGLWLVARPMPSSGLRTAQVRLVSITQAQTATAGTAWQAHPQVFAVGAHYADLLIRLRFAERALHSDQGTVSVQRIDLAPGVEFSRTIVALHRLARTPAERYRLEKLETGDYGPVREDGEQAKE